MGLKKFNQKVVKQILHNMTISFTSLVVKKWKNVGRGCDWGLDGSNIFPPPFFSFFKPIGFFLEKEQNFESFQVSIDESKNVSLCRLSDVSEHFNIDSVHSILVSIRLKKSEFPYVFCWKKRNGRYYPVTWELK